MYEARLSVVDLSKKFHTRYLFSQFEYTFNSSQIYAVTGPNGTGKSTLIGILSGYLLPTHGKVKLIVQNTKLPVRAEEYYKYISVCAPYTELIEEFTLEEMIAFYLQLISLSDKKKTFTTHFVLDLLNMHAQANRVIKNFSSGMKQRVKLALAVCNHKPVVLLDEPTANLDAQGIEWFSTAIKPLLSEKICIMASNLAHEIALADHVIHIPDWQPQAKQR